MLGANVSDGISCWQLWNVDDDSCHQDKDIGSNIKKTVTNIDQWNKDANQSLTWLQRFDYVGEEFVMSYLQYLFNKTLSPTSLWLLMFSHQLWYHISLKSSNSVLSSRYRTLNFLELEIFLKNIAGEIVTEKKSNVKMINAGNMPDGQVATFSSYVG